MPHATSRENPKSRPRHISAVMNDAVEKIRERQARPLVRLQERLPDGRIAVEVYDRTRRGDEPTYDFYCSGPQQALEWIQQMSSKRWITTEHLGAFAALMLAAFPEVSGVSA